jgi:hypothetical protein
MSAASFTIRATGGRYWAGKGRWSWSPEGALKIQTPPFRDPSSACESLRLQLQEVTGLRCVVIGPRRTGRRLRVEAVRLNPGAPAGDLTAALAALVVARIRGAAGGNRQP